MQNPHADNSWGFCITERAFLRGSVLCSCLAEACRDWLAAGHVAVTAVGLKEFVADVHRMHEILHMGPGRYIFLLLVIDDRAEVAILGDGSAVPALMLPI